jgi:uncharacterized membrane protein
MSMIEKTTEVHVPVRTAYDQWTQFEEFPKFMEGVESVHQLDDRRLHWRAEIFGKMLEWSAEISEQIPDTRIAWRSTSGAPNAGVVSFYRLADDRCRVTLQIDYEPQGLMETVGDWLGVMSRRVEGDLERFKKFIEERGVETGAWRGEIPSPEKR